MSVWQECVEVWLGLFEMPVPSSVPEDQFAMSTESGVTFVLENCVDHVMLSLRFPAAGFKSNEIANALLTMTDPQISAPFCVRPGHDGLKSFIVGIRLDLDAARPSDIEPAFLQLWDISTELTSSAW